MKIRLLFAQETIGSGGVERRRLTLIKLLDKSLFDIKIVCTKAHGPLADEIAAEGVEVIKVGTLDKIWRISRYKNVLDVIKRFKPHIIHGAVFEGVLLSTISGAIGKVPIIIAEETSDPVKRTKKATLLLKCLSIFADKFIGVSPAAYDYLLSKAKIDRTKLKLLINGVSIPPYVCNEDVLALQSELEISSDDIVIGSVGRIFNEVKLFTDLVDALVLLKDQYPKMKLLIVGAGPDKDFIKQYAIKKGVERQLLLVGYQHNTHPYFKLMDIFALVSSTESFGLAAVEAMFHKLPVIATKVGGLKDIVVNRETGMLVDVNKPHQIANAINFILSNTNTKREMGERGYLRATNNYSPERYVREVETLYLELLAYKGIIESKNFESLQIK